MRRTAFIRLTSWPIERQRARRGWPDDRPLALTVAAGGAQRLAAVDGLAAKAGLSVGQTLADARAIRPDLFCAPHDGAGDAAALRRLARWCERFAPGVAPVFDDPAIAGGRHGLYLETAGTAHLFGGETALLQTALARLGGFGISARAALADTPGQAWALAGFAAGAEQGLICPAGAGLEPLLGLPTMALRLAPGTVERLCELGLKRVGDVVRLPRASLLRRFGPHIAAQIDAAAGRAPEALALIRPAPEAFAHVLFAEPVGTLEALKAVSARLCKGLARELERLGLGARRTRLSLFRVDGRALEITAGAQAATMEEARWRRLWSERLGRAAERLDLGFGVDAARLSAEGLEPLQQHVAGSLTPEAAKAAQAESAAREVSERLAARLGSGAVVRLCARDSHWPERAQKAVLAGERGDGARWDKGAARPPFLLARPERVEALAGLPDGAPAQFRWRAVLHRVARAEGPERIAAEWWRADGPSRDYYRVETGQGLRYWLFREGLYGRETDAPNWFVHGCWP